MKQIPLLEAKDVEVRVQQVKNSNGKCGCALLLYKNARVDQRILDEIVGPLDWQREHYAIDGKLFCKVSVWDEKKSQWISKSDVGVESNTEAVKGEASDSFKRACFNWGIGRELYQSPFIWVNLDSSEVYGKNDKYYCLTKFNVAEMEFSVEKQEFTKLTIVDGKGNVRWKIDGFVSAPEGSTEEVKEEKTIKKSGASAKQIGFIRKLGKNVSQDEYNDILFKHGVSEDNLDDLTGVAASQIINELLKKGK